MPRSKPILNFGRYPNASLFDPQPLKTTAAWPLPFVRRDQGVYVILEAPPVDRPTDRPAGWWFELSKHPSNRISSAVDDAIDRQERRAPTPSCFTRIIKSYPGTALRAPLDYVALTKPPSSLLHRAASSERERGRERTRGSLA